MNTGQQQSLPTSIESASDLASLTIGRKRLIPREAIEQLIRERTGKRPALTRPPETAP